MCGPQHINNIWQQLNESIQSDTLKAKGSNYTIMLVATWHFTMVAVCFYCSPFPQKPVACWLIWPSSRRQQQNKLCGRFKNGPARFNARNSPAALPDYFSLVFLNLTFTVVSSLCINCFSIFLKKWNHHSHFASWKEKSESDVDEESLKFNHFFPSDCLHFFPLSVFHPSVWLSPFHSLPSSLYSAWAIFLSLLLFSCSTFTSITVSFSFFCLLWDQLHPVSSTLTD